MALLDQTADASENHRRPDSPSTGATTSVQAVPELLRRLAEAASLGLVVCDADGRILECNGVFATMLGRASNDIQGHSFLDFTVPDEREAEAEAFRRFVASGRDAGRVVKRYALPDGSCAWAEVFSVPVRAAEGRPFRLVALTRDITESQRVANSLRASELAYLHLFRETTDGVAVFDVVRDAGGRAADLRCVDVNPALERITGRPATLCIGRLAGEAWPAPATGWVQRLLTALQSGGPAHFEDPLFTTDRWFDVRLVSLSPDRCAMFVTDITRRIREEQERRQMMDRAQQLQKLESLGRLAGGIAHDFNNILMTVLGAADLARAELPPHHPGREHLDNIIHAARRASNLCRQLLDYAGRGRLTTADFSLNDLIEDMAHLLAISLPRNVRLDCELDPALPMVRGDPSRVMQAILNLVTNAAEAIGESSGVIRIATSTERVITALDAGPGTPDPLPPGDYVVFEVTDTGSGIPPEMLNQIFDPFFSTRMEGRGLGLPAVLGIVRSHGGGIRVRSRVGEGSTFQLLLPAVRPVAAAHSAPSGEPAATNLDLPVWILEPNERSRDSIVRIVQTCGRRPRAFAAREELLNAIVDGVNIGCFIVSAATLSPNATELLQMLRRHAPIVLLGDPPTPLDGGEADVRLPWPFVRADLANALNAVLGAPRTARSAPQAEGSS
ncbi:MAG: PAS domain-containing protein [Kiritimatiellae bacterium]|nr:PAS domain-containing protein [Kiritimatiellia bacterium]